MNSARRRVVLACDRNHRLSECAAKVEKTGKTPVHPASTTSETSVPPVSKAVEAPFLREEVLPQAAKAFERTDAQFRGRVRRKEAHQRLGAGERLDDEEVVLCRVGLDEWDLF